MQNSDKSRGAVVSDSVSDHAEDMKEIARTATGAVKREAKAIATGAADHPYAATSMVLAVSAFAFGLGYLLGRSAK